MYFLHLTLTANSHATKVSTVNTIIFGGGASISLHFHIAPHKLSNRAIISFQLPILENNKTTASRLNLLQSSKSAATPSSPMGDAFPVINNNSRGLTNGANNNRDENHSGNLPMTPTGNNPSFFLLCHANCACEPVVNLIVAILKLLLMVWSEIKSFLIDSLSNENSKTC